MKAFFWDIKTGRSGFRRVKRPALRPGEVVVRIRFSAPCGTDTHIVRGVLKTKAYASKIVLGHAWSGTVFALGRGARSLRIGDEVFGSDYFPCGRCAVCRRGKENLCDTRTVIGMERPGTHAAYAAVPARYTYRLPRGLSLSSAPFICDVVATADAAIRRARPRPDEGALIYGAGPLGLVLGMLLRVVYRVRKIFLVEPSPYRRRLARRLFHPQIITARQAASADRAISVAYDASGSAVAVADGLRRLARGGTFVLVGVHDEERTLPLTTIVSRQLTLAGSFTYPIRNIPRAVRLARLIHIERIITHRFPFARIQSAYRMFMQRKTGAVLVDLSGPSSG